MQLLLIPTPEFICIYIYIYTYNRYNRYITGDVQYISDIWHQGIIDKYLADWVHKRCAILPS